MSDDETPFGKEWKLLAPGQVKLDIAFKCFTVPMDRSRAIAVLVQAIGSRSQLEGVKSGAAEPDNHQFVFTPDLARNFAASLKDAADYIDPQGAPN